jgi:uncharacterized protein
MIADEEYTKLIEYLQGLGKVMVAFSGGVDSTFLLKAAREALGDQVKAVTILSPYIPQWEIAQAKELADELAVAYDVIRVPMLEEIKHNPLDRCYLCKKAVFGRIKELAAREGYNYVIDGTNYDDIGDYRPGLKALSELGIKSPLLECNITKAQIRRFSQELALPTWDKPPYACLLTRIPYGCELKEEDFRKIENAEGYLMKLGFQGVRVRMHGELARIEMAKSDMEDLFADKLSEQIVGKLQEFGFHYVTLDLQGYRTGSFNENLPSGQR